MLIILNLYVILDNWLWTNIIKLSKIKTFLKNEFFYNIVLLSGNNILIIKLKIKI